MADDDLANFAALLEVEREALLAGDFKGLQELEPEKTALLERLLGTGLEADAAKVLLGAVRRNDVLFEAALDGLRGAILRLSELQDLRSGFQGYAPDGQISRAATSGSRLARKA